MRGLGTIVLAVVVSGFVAGIVQLELGIFFHAEEEFIAVMTGQMLFVIALATALLLATLTTGTERAVTTVTLLLVIVVVLGTAAIEGAGLLMGASPGEVITVDGPILLEAVVPALIAALIQWWMVRRYIRRSSRASSAI